VCDQGWSRRCGSTGDGAWIDGIMIAGSSRHHFLAGGAPENAPR
jgi:hypothetical protein